MSLALFLPHFPERTNVEFVSEKSSLNFRVRVWERGAGITKACGSGAVAVAWALKEANLIEDIVDIDMDGGRIQIKIEGKKLMMRGRADGVFTGEIEL